MIAIESEIRAANFDIGRPYFFGIEAACAADNVDEARKAGAAVFRAAYAADNTPLGTLVEHINFRAAYAADNTDNARWQVNLSFRAAYAADNRRCVHLCL